MKTQIVLFSIHIIKDFSPLRFQSSMIRWDFILAISDSFLPDREKPSSCFAAGTKVLLSNKSRLTGVSLDSVRGIGTSPSLHVPVSPFRNQSTGLCPCFWGSHTTFWSDKLQTHLACWTQLHLPPDEQLYVADSGLTRHTDVPPL